MMIRHVEISDCDDEPLLVPYTDLLDILFNSSSIQYLGIPLTSETLKYNFSKISFSKNLHYFKAVCVLYRKYFNTCFSYNFKR